MAEVKRLGFVGLGMMGGGMAKNLLKSGYGLNVFDVDQTKMKEFKALGATLMGSPKEVAMKSEVVLSSLPDPATVKKVYLGPDGMIEAASSSSILIDLSTVDPETSRSNNKTAAAKSVKYLDAPVSGGPKEAEGGKLILIVGGDRDAFEKCKKIFDVLGPTVHYAGPSGAGNVVKLVNNVMSMGNVLVAAEAFTLGVKAGVDGQTLFNILRTSGGRSHHFEKRFPNVLARNFEAGFTVDLAKKDLGLALDMAKSLNVPIPTASLVHQFYSVMSSIGAGKKDCVAIINLFESWAGLKM
jgi:3-hydroxyisobutyrate dehydrogenase